MYSTIRRNLTFYFVQHSPAFLIPSHPIIAEVRFNKRKRATRFRQASLREALAPLHRLQRSFLSIPFPPSITRSRQGKNKKREKELESPVNHKPIAASQNYRFRKDRRCWNLSMVFFFTSSAISHNPLSYF